MIWKSGLKYPLPSFNVLYCKYQEYLYQKNYYMKNSFFAPITTRKILCIKERKHFSGDFIYRCMFFNYLPIRCFNAIPFSFEYNNSIVSLLLGVEI